MTGARAFSALPAGTGAHLTEIEAGITSGTPCATVTGLPAGKASTLLDRVRVAILNSGEQWPQDVITIRIAPGQEQEAARTSILDLAVAASVLTAAGAAPPGAAGDVMLLAELGLDGRLRPVPGIRDAVAAAAEAGMKTVITAPADQAEAALDPRVDVIGTATLADVTDWLRRRGPRAPRPGGPAPGPREQRGDGEHAAGDRAPACEVTRKYVPASPRRPVHEQEEHYTLRSTGPGGTDGPREYTFYRAPGGRETAADITGSLRGRTPVPPGSDLFGALRAAVEDYDRARAPRPAPAPGTGRRGPRPRGRGRSPG